MSEASTSSNAANNDGAHEGRDNSFMDIDRMVNEGLGGGYVTVNNGMIDDSTTDTMNEQESAANGGELS